MRKILILSFVVCLVFVSCGKKKYTMEEAEEVVGVYYIRIMMDLKKCGEGEISLEDLKLYTRINLGKIKKVLENTEMSDTSRRLLMNTFEAYCNDMVGGGLD